MKKLAVFVAIALFMSVAAFSQENEKTGEKWSNFSYFNVPVLKIMEAREGFLITYQKNGLGTGTTVIPKKWAKGNEENPRKLVMRSTSGTVQPYMSVVSKDGQFHRVILTVPVSKRHPVWGLLEYSSTNMEGVDKETMEELPLF